MLCCGRRCGCLTGPLRGYQSALAAGQWLPDLKITNNMNREAILQARRAAPATPPAPPCMCACAASARAPPRSTRADTHRGLPAGARCGAAGHMRASAVPAVMRAEAAARLRRRTRRWCSRVRSGGDEPIGLTRAGGRGAPQITGLPEQDVLFVRFEADVSGRACLPYFIALDRTTRSIGAAAPRLPAGGAGSAGGPFRPVLRACAASLPASAARRSCSPRMRSSSVKLLALVCNRPRRPALVLHTVRGRRAVVCIRGTLSLDDCLTDAMCEPAEIDDWLAVVDGGDGTPVDGAGAAPGAAADGPPPDTPNSLMAGARNSPLPPARRHTADEAARDRGGRGGAGGGAGGRWQPLAGPLGQAPGEGAGAGVGDGGARGSEGRDDGGQEPAADAPPRRRRFSTGALGRSFSGHRPPPVQVRAPPCAAFRGAWGSGSGVLVVSLCVRRPRPGSLPGPAYAPFRRRNLLCWLPRARQQGQER